MGNPKIIYLRSELNYNEYRCPIVPLDTILLIQKGFIVYVESSKNRIYEDIEYEKAGAIITTDPWYDEKYKSGLIIGLKDIPKLDKLDSHRHIYFSHSFKNQKNSEIILDSFKKSNSIIYDYEFLLDSNKKRKLAFGFYAGFVGCCLGLMQYYSKQVKKENISNLKPYKFKMDLLNNIQKLDAIKIVVIGPNGRSGSGVITVLDHFKIPFNKLCKTDSKTNLEKYDIVFNCILLEKNLNEVWFDEKTIFNKPIIIVDISCDYSSLNNPIKIYNEPTTWEKPVFSYNENVDIIAINNLPSLLPKDSSNEFSEILVKLLLIFNNDLVWENNKNYYYDIINKLIKIN